MTLRNKCKKRKVLSLHTVTVWERAYFTHHFLTLIKVSFLTQIFLSSVIAEDTGTCQPFCSEGLAPHDSVQTFNAYIHIVNIILYICIYIYRTWLSASCGSTVTYIFCLQTKWDTHKRQLHCFKLFTFFVFFFVYRIHNIFDWVTFM